MAVRKIYVNPGDVLIVKVLEDPTVEKNERGWSGNIVRPFSFTMSPERHGVTFHDPDLDIGIAQCSKKRRRVN